MQGVVKKVLIAVGLLVVGVVVLTATKAYGVWVISGIAVVLFVLGILRKEQGPTGEKDGGKKAGTGQDGDPEGRDSHEAR